jgi:hypothetical protein
MIPVGFDLSPWPWREIEAVEGGRVVAAAAFVAAPASIEPAPGHGHR